MNDRSTFSADGEIGELIEARARLHPGQPALIHGPDSWSYGELMARSGAVAARLREIFAETCPQAPVPRVGLFCPNGVDYVTLALAILQTRACFVPVATELAPPEREAQVTLTAQHLVIAAGPHPWLPGPGTMEKCGGMCWQWAAAGAPAQFPEDRFCALAPVFVRFSSGTTGTSKGVVLGREALLARIASANRRLRITREDRVLWTLPMAHHFAVSIVLYLLAGATVVLEDSHLAADVLTTARQAGATVIYGSPFHHALLAAEESGRDWPTLRLAVSTAAALSVETARAFARRFGVPLAQGLGIIEAGLPLLNGDAPVEKPLSVGRADDVAVSLRTEHGTEAEPGELGELCLRGPGLFDAYLLPWCDRAQVLRDGWFATGDLAMRDAQGHIFLQGRCKSVINVGGMKFFPEEVEAVLDAHPAVRASRVFGEAHERWEMIPMAQIVLEPGMPAPTAAALARYCREHLAGYKAPLRFHVVATLPRTASGKLKR